MKRRLAVMLVALLTVAVPSPAQALPAGSIVWFHPGGDQFTPSQIWLFEGTTRTGWRRNYIPSLTAFPVQNQDMFTYQTIGSTDHLRWTVSGGASQVTVISRDQNADILTVNHDGFTQTWYGCRSTGRPLYAQAACW